MIEYIEYKKTKYPTTWVVLDDWGFEMVATESLKEALIPNGKYADDQAKVIDDGIYFYVPDEMIDCPNLDLYVMMHTM